MNNLPSSGACDCHVHIVGPALRYPQVADRSYTADLAPIDTLRGLGRPMGVTRFVLVQPSFYGMDNTCVLDTLDALEGNGRGVVVVDPLAFTSKQIEEYSRRGVCGVRVNFYSKFNPLASAGVGEVLRRFMAILPRAGWHIEIIANLDTVIDAEAAIRSSTLPIILDHYGVPGSATPESALGRKLLDLLRLPHMWMKVSAPYRSRRRRSDRHRSARRLARGAHRSRAGPLRLGQRLAASAFARRSEGQERDASVPEYRLSPLADRLPAGAARSGARGTHPGCKSGSLVRFRSRAKSRGLEGNRWEFRLHRSLQRALQLALQRAPARRLRLRPNSNAGPSRKSPGACCRC